VLAPTIVGATATVPPTLASLEQAWTELKVTSLRFSTHTSIHLSHGGRTAQCLSKLLGGGSQSGEYTAAPAAASVSLEFLGIKWKLRQVGKTVYAYLRSLARYDHGRPWLRLGKGGLSELFHVKGRHVASVSEPELLPVTPKLAEPPFSQLTRFLDGAREIRELGPATIDGQSVTRFLVVPEPTELETELSATTPSVQRVNASSSATVEVALAASGLPVRTEITVHTSASTTTYTLEIPAVNFPLVISAPPADETTTVHRLRQLARHGDLKRSKKSEKPRNPFAGCDNSGGSL
jgi:hypothetical protein